MELGRALWFDMSPMRPDDWASTDAARWRSNVAIRNAYHEGVTEANDEHEANQDLKRRPDG